MMAGAWKTQPLMECLVPISGGLGCDSCVYVYVCMCGPWPTPAYLTMS